MRSDLSMPLPIYRAPLSVEVSNAADTVFVALGANLPGPFGQAEASIGHALTRMDAAADAVLAGGELYQTPAYPPGNGPDFVNAVVALRAADPMRLIAAAFAIEAEFDREAERSAGRWAPRSIDVDIIAVGGEIWPDAETHAALRALPPRARVLTETGLVVPHPAMHERAFVLKPMAYFAPEWRHPALGHTARELALALPQADLDAVVPIG